MSQTGIAWNKSQSVQGSPCVFPSKALCVGTGVMAHTCFLGNNWTVKLTLLGDILPAFQELPWTPAPLHFWAGRQLYTWLRETLCQHIVHLSLWTTCPLKPWALQERLKFCGSTLT